jgi:transposase-like protein
VLLKRDGKAVYRWRCNTCGRKFTAPATPPA